MFLRWLVGALKECFRIGLGWIVLAYFGYYLVIQQFSIVIDPLLLGLVLFIGIAASFIFSSSEMALAECGSSQIETLEKESIELTKFINGLADKELRKKYNAERIRIQEMQEIIENATDYNPSIVIGNNIANVAVTSFVPLALGGSSLESRPAPITNIEKQILEFFGSESFPIGGEGLFTFFSVTVLIIIFGEIIPKRLAINNPMTFVKFFRIIIKWSKLLLGWLGYSLVAVERIFR